MGTDRQLAWATHRDAHPEHNIPHAPAIFDAGFEAGMRLILALGPIAGLAEHDREVEQNGRRAGLQEAIDIIGGEDPSGGMVSVTHLIRELYELISEPEPAGDPSPETQDSSRCPRCRHAEHEGYACFNMASDNDCACPPTQNGAPK